MSITLYESPGKKNIICVKDQDTDDCICLYRTYDMKYSSDWKVCEFNGISLKSWEDYNYSDLIIDVDNTIHSIETIKVYSPKQHSAYFTLIVPICNTCNDVAMVKCNTCSIDNTTHLYCSKCVNILISQGGFKCHTFVDII